MDFMKELHSEKQKIVRKKRFFSVTIQLKESRKPITGDQTQSRGLFPSALIMVIRTLMKTKLVKFPKFLEKDMMIMKIKIMKRLN